MANVARWQVRTVVITRPAHQADAIIHKIQSHGAKVVGFPLLDIVEPSDPEQCKQQLADVSQYDLLIFTSRNAVERAISKLPAKFPANLKVAAVGTKTADSLARHGIEVSVVPSDTFNSEALLACAELQSIEGSSIAIIRGEGGRELLRDTLVNRGASVDYIDVYRRVCPAGDLLPLVKLQERGGLDIIVLTSVETLQHLFRLGKGQLWLNGVTLLVGSERISLMVKQTSHSGHVLIADDPSDASIFSRLEDWINDKNI